MGFNPPSRGLLIQADAPGETPLTMHTEIWWTPGYVTGTAAAAMTPSRDTSSVT